jgi:hypothetical protein
VSEFTRKVALVPPTVVPVLHITTKSVYVLGIELKVTVPTAAPSVIDAIGVYVAAIITP